MRFSTLMLAVALLAPTALTTTAAAQGGLASAFQVPPRGEGPPARLLDRMSLVVDVNAGESTNDFKYGLSVLGRFYGYDLRQDDSVKIAVKLGGREVANARCRIQMPGERLDEHLPGVNGFAYGAFNCQTERTIENAGPLEVVITYRDDATDRETAMEPVIVPIALSYQWNAPYVAVPYVDQPDRLGAATIMFRAPPFGPPKVIFTFWANPKHELQRPDSDDLAFRCSHDGQRIPQRVAPTGSFLHARGGNRTGFSNERHENDEFGQSYYELSTELRYRGEGSGPADGWDLAQHPGQYVCELRFRDETVREFRFVVAADGSIAPHAEQTQGGLFLPPFQRLIDVRIPNPTHWDRGLAVAPMRAGAFYGRPWGHAAGMRSTLDALPRRDVGSLVPARPRGTIRGPSVARGGRRR